MFRVKGRVSLRETDEGLPGLHVKAIDKDLFFDDVVGSAVTDADGRYEITYDKKDFAELFEKSPDLYVVVRNAANRILASSEETLRANAGTDETIDVVLTRAQVDGVDPESPYGPAKGRVQIRLAGGATAPAETRLSLTEHRPRNRKQHTFTFAAGETITADVPTGEYSVQLGVRGHETLRGLVVVDERGGAKFEGKLTPREKREKTIEERLKRYGLDANELPSLEVPARTQRALDHAKANGDKGARKFAARSIAQLKQWLGTDDARYGHDRPVFGPLPALRDGDQKNGANDAALDAIAREYVYGNSASVSQYAALLDRSIHARVIEGLVVIPAFFYTVVDIGPGATLTVGNGSSLFFCHELRIHKTGTLRVVGPVKVDVGSWTEYE